MLPIAQDLDINVKSLDLRYKLDDTTFYTRSEGHAVNRLTTTYVAVPNDHVRCDIAARGNIEALLPYTKEFDGIRYASEPLLLADKIRTVGQRAAGNDAKRDTDLEDVMTMASEMERQGMKMPQELIDMYLTEEDIQCFWEAVPPVERGTFKLFLEFVGIPEM